jgi:hypothetical protein
MNRRLFVSRLALAALPLAPALCFPDPDPPHVERVTDLRGVHPANVRLVVAKLRELAQEWPSANARILSVLVVGGRWPAGIWSQSTRDGEILLNRAWWRRRQGPQAARLISHEFGHHLEWWLEAVHYDAIAAFRVATAGFPWVSQYVRRSPHPEWEQFPEGFSFLEMPHGPLKGYLRAQDLFLRPFAGE